MAWRVRTRLGLAFTGRRLLAAELRLNGRPRVRAVAELPLESAEALQDAAATGKALRQLLKANNIRAKQVMIGLPAKWLMTRMHPVPPADPQALRDLLRLGADRVFTLDAEHLMMDYIPPAEAAGAESGAVMMVAATRDHVRQAMAIAEAAGLRVEGVTSSTAALAAAMDGDAAVLRCDEESAELALRRDGRLAALLHVGHADELVGSLKRLLAGEPQLASHLRDACLHVTTWQGGDDAMRRELAAACDTKVRPLRLEHVNGLDDADTMRQFAPAIATGLAGAERRWRPLDLLNSRLAEPHRSHVLVRWRAAILAAVVALAAVGALALSIQREQAELTDLKTQLDAGEPDAAAARQVVERVRLAEQWLRHRPKAMEMLREMTLAFPERGTVWLTELTVREDHSAVLNGRAEQDRDVLELRDRLSGSEGISQVKLLFMREAGRSEKQINFAIALHLDRPSVMADEPPAAASKTMEVTHAEQP